MGYAILDQRGGDSLTATTLDGYSLLADTTVSSATTTVNFTGLNIGWGDELLLVSDFVTSGTSQGVFLTTNGNDTLTNYYLQQLYVSSTSVSSSRYSSARIMSTDTGTKSYATTKIKITNNGFFVFQSEQSRTYGGSSIVIDKYNATSTFNISSITSLKVTAELTNGISVGSRFQLYKSGGGASRTWAIT